jgi:peptidyl-prolyl cis-trans isomerase SurA
MQQKVCSMKKIMMILASTFVLASVPVLVAQAEQTMGIAAVVNDEAISMRDVEDRIRLVLASSGLPDQKDIRAKITPQIIDGLVEEQIKLQEAARNNLLASDEEVQEGLATIAKQNNFSPEQFLGLMQKQGISKSTLLRQIRAQLSWNNVVKQKLRSQVDVTETDVNAYIDRIKGKIGQTEYMVAEIFLPTDNPARKAEVEQLASRMAPELQAKKAPFGPVAMQFSKAAGAEKGGSLGWITDGDLEPALDAVVKTLSEGQVSDPIKTTEGIYILMLQKKRTISEESIPPREEITNTIGFERLDRVQQRALLDLKSAAFIDRRV